MRQQERRVYTSVFDALPYKSREFIQSFVADTPQRSAIDILLSTFEPQLSRSGDLDAASLKQLETILEGARVFEANSDKFRAYICLANALIREKEVYVRFINRRFPDSVANEANQNIIPELPTRIVNAVFDLYPKAAELSSEKWLALAVYFDDLSEKMIAVRKVAQLEDSALLNDLRRGQSSNWHSSATVLGPPNNRRRRPKVDSGGVDKEGLSEPVENQARIGNAERSKQAIKEDQNPIVEDLIRRFQQSNPSQIEAQELSCSLALIRDQLNHILHFLELKREQQLSSPESLEAPSVHARALFKKARREEMLSYLWWDIEFKLKLKPTPEQILASLLITAEPAANKRGNLAEMDTGEGKSIVIAVAAGYFVKIGYAVDVVCPNNDLATRDYQQFSKLVLGARGGLNHTLKFPQTVQFTTPIRLASEYLRSTQHGRLKRFNLNESPRVLILDEADQILIDDRGNGLRMPGDEPIKSLEAALNSNFKRSKGRSLEDPQALQDILGEIKKSKNRPQRRCLLRQLAMAVNRAANDQPGVHYVIRDEQVIPVAWNSSGEINSEANFAPLQHSVITHRHQLNQTFYSIGSLIGFPFLLGLYTRCAMVTATSGVGTPEGEHMLSTHRVSALRVPRANPNMCQIHDPVYCGTREARNEAILEAAQKIVKDRRPVLVIMQSINEVAQLAKLFESNNLPHQRYDGFVNLSASGSESVEEILGNAGLAGQITIATVIAGRGTDIRVSDEVSMRGGLHVIIGFYPLNQRQMIQLSGRAGRMGSNGSAQCIINLQDDPRIHQQIAAGLLNTQDFASIAQQLQETQQEIGKLAVLEADVRGYAFELLFKLSSLKIGTAQKANDRLMITAIDHFFNIIQHMVTDKLINVAEARSMHKHLYSRAANTLDANKNEPTAINDDFASVLHIVEGWLVEGVRQVMQERNSAHL